MLLDGPDKYVSIEHSTDEFTVALEVAKANNHVTVTRSVLLRTARRLIDGHAYIPQEMWVSAV